MNRMKSTLLFLCLIIGPSSFGQSLTDVANSNELTWYGIDFTKARFVGFSNAEMVKEIADSLTSTWSGNHLIGKEEKLLKKQFGKESIHISTATVEKRNAAIDFSKEMVDHSYSLDHEDINKVVSEYKFSGKGYGVLLIVETFEMQNEKVFVWATYVNNATGQLISSRRYSGIVSGVAASISITRRQSIKGNNKGNESVSYWKRGIDWMLEQSAKDLKEYKY